jgi:hypothetical protein
MAVYCRILRRRSLYFLHPQGTLKMKAVDFTKTLSNFYRNTWRYIAEHRNTNITFVYPQRVLSLYVKGSWNSTLRISTLALHKKDKKFYLKDIYQLAVGHAVVQCLRYCATNRKVAVSFPNGVIGIFHWHNPSGRTMALGSTQPLTEMSNRNNSWG